MWCQQWAHNKPKAIYFFFRYLCTHLIFAAAAVEAGIGGAVVDVGFAESADEAFAALALELVVEVEALGCSSRVAEVGGALVDGRLAVKAGVAWTAVANVTKVAVYNRFIKFR